MCISGFSKDAVDYDIKKAMKSDVLEITDNPQEYFITQEKPVSIVSNLTSSLKKVDSSSEPKKSVTFRHDLITGKTFLLALPLIAFVSCFFLSFVQLSCIIC